METTILEKIDEIEEEIIEGIKGIVRIDSVRSVEKPGMPYGEGINEALEKTLKLAKRLGFTTENIAHQVGIVKYGEGEDYIGVFGHLDVVEVGEGWQCPPFSAHEDKNGRIFARGILDNKGPILANLYALYTLKELGIPVKRPIWIIFGTNEETGFADMRYYLTKKQPPIMGWTPDCKYPVVYAERGRSSYQISTGIENQEEFITFVNEYLLSSSKNAERLSLNIKDEEFGEMEMRGLKLVYKNKQTLCFEFTFSYPASITNSEIEASITSKLSKNLQLVCMLNYNSVYFDKECFLCQTLKETYEKITGMDGTPVTTTGGTYAKIVPNILPFGPSFPNQKGIGHNPNEWMDRKDLIINTKIYALSMYRLATKEEL